METVGRLPTSTINDRRFARRADDRHAPKARVLIVDEHEITGVGLALALSGQGWVTTSTCDIAAADILRCAREFAPWCVLVGYDAGADVAEGTRLVAELVAHGSEVILLTTERRRAVLAEFLEVGAAGWIPRSVSLEVLQQTLAQARDGVSVVCASDRIALLDLLRRERAKAKNARATIEQLTDREASVLVALCDGLNAEQIADEHFVSVATIRSQIRSVLLKLDVRSQLAAASIAAEYRELLPVRDGSRHDRRRIRAGATG